LKFKASAATYVGRGGIHYMGLVYNLLLFLTVKEIWKSVRFWQSYHHRLVVHFFGTPCICSTCRVICVLPLCLELSVSSRYWYYIGSSGI